MNYTAAQIAEHMDVTERAIQKRATRESWLFTKRPGKGGGRLFQLSDLPEDVRLAIAAKSCPYTPPPITPGQEAGLAAVMRLKGKALDRADARASVVVLYRSFAATAGLADTPCREAFAARWAAGEIEADPWVRESLPKFSANSLRNWVETATKKGSAALGGNFGKHRKGTGLIDSNPEVRATILGMLYEYPHSSTQLVREYLEAIFTKRGVKIPSLRRLQAWVTAWKEENRSTWEFIKAPDAWRSKFLKSTGDAYELITHQNQRWEYDGTPSDIMLSDGKRYAIIGVINIFDRRLKLDVVETSTAMAVANLTRRALLDWGIPETVVTDNGKDFVARYLQHVFGTLGIYQDILPPFRPDLKPGIERAFRTFSHHIITLLPCYVGHNVATRQQIRDRETFAKRLMAGKKKDEKPEELSMAVAPEELQRICDEWCENVYAHKSHAGLKGKTPFEISREWIAPVRRIEDVRALDLLLMPLATQDGWRTVGKKGISCPGGTFDAPELSGMVGDRVRVRVDPDDASHVYVYSESGDFVAKAVHVGGLAPSERRELSSATRRAGQGAAKAGRKELKDMAKRTGADKASERIMEFHAERAEKIRQAAGPGQQQFIPHTTPELEAAADAANAHVPAVAITEQAREIVPGFTPPATAQERYKLLLALQAREDLTEAEAKWARIYAACNEADGFRQMYQICAANG